MRPSPTYAEVALAERRVSDARYDVARAWWRTRVALRFRLARPSSLLVAAALGVALAAWWRRAPRRRPPRARAVESSSAQVARAFLLRAGFRRLLEQLQRWRDMRRGAPANTRHTNERIQPVSESTGAMS